MAPADPAAVIDFLIAAASAAVAVGIVYAFPGPRRRFAQMLDRILGPVAEDDDRATPNAPNVPSAAAASRTPSQEADAQR